MRQNIIKFSRNNTNITFLKTGDLYSIEQGEIMVNQLNGNILDGSCNQIYLRVHNKEEIKWAPMIGFNSKSLFWENEEQLNWRGVAFDVTYQVAFKLADNGMWFWKIDLQGEGQVVDVIYGQDIGNANKDAVRSNEAYMSQYLDHHVSKENQEIIISSRQNQPQNGKNPVVEQGSFNNLDGFSVDGYQFFGRSYKETNIPEILNKKHLENEVYQYEFAYIALQTEQYTLSLQKQEVVFYGVAVENHIGAVEKAVYSRTELKEIFEKLDFKSDEGRGKVCCHNLAGVIVGQELSKEELDKYFPQQEQKEYDGKTLLSFFTNNYHHVVLKAKESMMERAHGHILLSGTDVVVDKPLLSTTAYMYGVFNSQLVLGNTSMNMLLSNTRNALNIMKRSGQRIYIKGVDGWSILTMPSAFEMGLNSATWYYKLADDLIKIMVYTLNDSREVRMEIASEQGKSYSWSITNHITMNSDDEKSLYVMQESDNALTIKVDETSAIHKSYKDLTYYIAINKPFTITDERLFVENEEQGNLLVMVIEQQSNINMTIQGTLTGEEFKKIDTTIEVEDNKYTAFIDELLNHFKLEHESKSVAKMNILARWYSHDMLVHYMSPHGLEQYGGAAWGTRDVSQGPTEYFLSINRADVVADIIDKLYSNQFENDGNWPASFMFDKYEYLRGEESHGDIIIWPIKVVTDYLDKSKDYEILNREIPYTNHETYLKTKEKYALLKHVKKAVNYIETHFLEGTYLSGYGNGDWDDTLQPNDSRLKKQMASSWTVALTFQVLKKASGLFSQVDKEFGKQLGELANNIEHDFKKYLLKENTLPGFVYMSSPKDVEYMIYPGDKRSNIDYRLLPMTRSMIAEIFTKEQAEHHWKIIKEHLYFTDGVHLMNRPADYTGGVSKIFKRAEQAANVGREIGLQYVHAHIRFAEAMAKLGKGEETWRAMQMINPILLKEDVPNAEIRQSNAYFSSSDGNFKTRYEAQAKFGKLKHGEVSVKGGWRVYSSGPGIYINQLITNILGIRETDDQVTFDPVLPKELDGMIFNYQILGYQTKIIYCLNTEEKKVIINDNVVQGDIEENAYRQGGIMINTKELSKYLGDKNEIIIYC